MIATGLARGAAAKGKRIAFGDGRKILWGPHSTEIFKGNPNIAPRGSEHASDIEWIHYFKGQRLYNRHKDGRWVWNYEFRPQPGEVFLDPHEIAFAKGIKPGFVLIEPNVPWHKLAAVNKDWGLPRYQALADKLLRDGRDVAQFAFGQKRIVGARIISPPTFRHALAVLKRAALVVTPEGGLHHGAAAVGAKAVVIFGSWIPPGATGYAMHVNLTGDGIACGSLKACEHCRASMASISVRDVYEAALGCLANG